MVAAATVSLRTYISGSADGVNGRLMMQIVHCSTADVIKQLHTPYTGHTFTVQQTERLADSAVIPVSSRQHGLHTSKRFLSVHLKNENVLKTFVIYFPNVLL